MKFRLEKPEEGVPFVDIPIGHIAKGVVNKRRVLRALDHGVSFPGFDCDSVRSFEGKYIDLGPLGDEKPKVVPFGQIPVGHVGRSTGGEVFLRTDSGGVFIGCGDKAVQVKHSAHVSISFFNFLYEDLGKLVIEP